MLIRLEHNQKHLTRNVRRCMRSRGVSHCLPAAALTRTVLLLTAIAVASLLTAASSSAAQNNNQAWTRQNSSRPEQSSRTQRNLRSDSRDDLDEVSAVPEPTSLFSESRPQTVRENRVIPASYVAASEGSTSEEIEEAGEAGASESDASTMAIETQTDAALSGVDGDKPVAEPFLDLNSEESPVASRNAETGTADSTESIVRTLSTCIILGCCAILTLLGLRKWQRGRGLLPGAGGRSRVIETLSLGPGRTVSLIEMDGLRALVGADAGGIRTIVMAPRAFSDEMAESQAIESGSMSI